MKLEQSPAARSASKTSGLFAKLPGAGATTLCIIAVSGTSTVAPIVPTTITAFSGTRSDRVVLEQLPDATVRTVGATPNELPELDRDLVHWVKDNSGLTWDQLSRVFGVSRRAVHMWATGSRISAAKAELLRQFAAEVQRVAGATPDETRAALLASSATHRSIVDQYRARVCPRSG